MLIGVSTIDARVAPFGDVRCRRAGVRIAELAAGSAGAGDQAGADLGGLDGKTR